MLQPFSASTPALLQSWRRELHFRFALQNWNELPSPCQGVRFARDLQKSAICYTHLAITIQNSSQIFRIFESELLWLNVKVRTGRNLSLQIWVMFSLLNRRKNVQPRGFNYKPRSYDEDKEEFRDRIRKRMEANEGDKDAVKSRISRSFREGRQNKRSSAYKSAAMRSNIILIAVVIGLCFFVYTFIQNYLPTMIESWFN